MNVAKAMALGGQRVYPEQCDFYSYKKLLLRCCFCGQEVCLKKGSIRKSHFAHFAGTDPKQIEECELRVSTDGNSTETSGLIENRGQRLEIFQQHFLSLIYVGQEKIVNDVKFNNWIDSIKQSDHLAINNITNDCIEYFLKYHNKIKQRYVIPLTNVKDKQILFQQQIAFEGIDYLCVKSSSKLLEYIIHYCIYQLYKEKFTKNNIDLICHTAIKIIMLNPWIKALDNTKVINSSTTNISQLFESKIVEFQSPSSLEIFLQDIQDASQLYDLEQAKVNSKWIVSGSIDIDINQINASERHALENKLDLQLTFPAWEYGNVDKQTGLPSRKKVFVSCKLVTEANPDDKTALRFSFMTSQNVNVKVTTETYLPAVVYSFGYDFTLTVEKYSDLLFAKNGKLMEYPHITKRDELASLLERMIKDNKVDFIKMYIDDKGKKRILHTYDDTVLILLALKRRTQLDNISIESTTDVKKGTYNKITNKIVMEAFIEAYQKSLECSVKLPNTTIDNYHRYAQFKLTEANSEHVKTTVENYIVNNSDAQIHKATHDVKKCQQSARSVIREHQPSASDSDISRLAMLITEYIFTKLNLNKSQAVALLSNLKQDVNQYIKIRDLVIKPELDHLKEVAQKVSALSNSSDFGVSFSLMGGKKLSTPIIYTMEVSNTGEVVLYYHYSEKIKNAITDENETSYKKREVAKINAAPGTLKVVFQHITLDKLAFGDYSFHHELLENYAIPFWIKNAENYVLANKLKPVWMVTSKPIEITCMDDNHSKLTLTQLQNTLPFTEVQWYQTLIQCSEQCPSVPQFANAVRNIPDKFKYLTGVTEVPVTRILPQVVTEIITDATIPEIAVTEISVVTEVKPDKKVK
ncbi:competence protein CoiA family protein [Nostoc sp.]|uniref:competence protein CoiA family protein n=1 Tax=Nostoc sp. TaxID=1180 RepID=UPI002FFD251A